jgi:hypothetical protein
MVPKGVFLQELHEPTISKALAKANKVAESSHETPPPPDGITESPEVLEIYFDWHTPFMIYLRTGGLPEDKVEGKRLRQQARQYTLVNDELYRSGTNGTLMKCITLEEGQIIFHNIHAGDSGSHTGAKSLMGKTYQHAFFWPTAVSNADSIVKVASFLPARNMCHLNSCSPYPLPGHFPHDARFGWSFEES